MRRIFIVIIIIVAGTIAVFAYSPVLHSLKNMFRGKSLPAPQVTFLAVPANTGSTVFRVGVLPKDFPREFLPPAFYGLATQRVVFMGGETQTIASFESAISLETLRLWYVQQFPLHGWEVQSEHKSADQVSLRALKSSRLSVVVTLQNTEPAQRRVSLIYSVRPF